MTLLHKTQEKQHDEKSLRSTLILADNFLGVLTFSSTVNLGFRKSHVQILHTLNKSSVPQWPEEFQVQFQQRCLLCKKIK